MAAVIPSTMPPGSYASRCVYYMAQPVPPFSPEVEKWLTGRDHPSPHGRIKVPGHEGYIYHLGTLAKEDEQRGEWPAEVHAWLRAHSGDQTALIAVWPTG